MPYRINTALLGARHWGASVGQEFYMTRSRAALQNGGSLNSDEIAAWQSVSVELSPSDPSVTSSPADFLSGFFLSSRVATLLRDFDVPEPKRFPVPTFHAITKAKMETRYAFYLPVFIDCIDYENTIFLRGPEEDEEGRKPASGLAAAKASGFDVARGEKLKLKKNALGNCHFWRASPPAHARMFISDELHQTFISESVTGLLYEACEVI